MQSIIILTGHHLCHNPRVLKEATSLAQAGFDVEILGAWTDTSLKARDQDLLSRASFRFTPVLDLPGAQLQRLMRRMQNKAGQLAYRFGNVPNRWQLGAVVGALGRTARQRDADLFIAHSEAALAVAHDLLHGSRRVGLDMEDWFSEDLLPEARRQRPIRLLRDLERDLLCRGVHATCPSHAMSDALKDTYGCSRPTVTYNAFPLADRKNIDRLRKDRRDPRIPSVHWFSQTLGPGRGLEDLLASLPHLNHDVEIHLRGNRAAGFDSWLSERLPDGWRQRIVFHDLVSNDELLSRISEHDIGFAGEMKYCRSRDLTVTNKILQYLLAGLAVIASDTTGQREVAEKAHGGVLLYPSGDAAALAAQLNALLASPDQLRQSKTVALKAAEQTFCWERQEKALVDAVKSAFRAQ
jgi:glycosyltransferase involved in cell wall biosynthesis